MDRASASEAVDAGLIPESGQAKDFRNLAFIVPGPSLSRQVRLLCPWETTLTGFLQLLVVDSGAIARIKQLKNTNML